MIEPAVYLPGPDTGGADGTGGNAKHFEPV